MTNSLEPLWFPLRLHRPAADYPDRHLVPMGFGSFSVQPFRLEVQPDYPYFECKENLAELSSEQMLPFCKFWKIESGESQLERFDAIVKWQESILIQKGFVRRTMTEVVDMFDWGKAIPRRQSYEIDKARLIDMTGYLEIQDAVSNLSLFACTDEGYAPVLSAQVTSGWYSSAEIRTKGWILSQNSDAVFYMEPAKPLAREAFLEMLAIPSEGNEGSPGLREMQKHLQVLDSTFRKLAKYEVPERWSFELVKLDDRYYEKIKSIEIPAPNLDSEKIKIRCKGVEQNRGAQIEYILPILLTPLFLVAAFQGLRGRLMKADPDVCDDSPNRYRDPDREVFNILSKWIEQLKTLATYDPVLLEYLRQAPLADLGELMVPELELLGQLK